MGAGVPLAWEGGSLRPGRPLHERVQGGVDRFALEDHLEHRAGDGHLDAHLQAHAVNGERDGDPLGGQTAGLDLGEAARDQRGLAVVAEAEAIAHAGGQCDDVLERPGHFHADHVRAGVDPQVRWTEEGLDALRQRTVMAGDGRGRRLAGSDLGGQVGSRQDRHRRAGSLVGDDLAEPTEASGLDPLGGEHQGQRRSAASGQSVPGKGAHERSHGAAGHGHDRQLGRLRGCGHIGRHVDVVRKREPRQVGRVLARARESGGLVGTARPQRDAGSAAGEHGGEDGAPGARPEHGHGAVVA